VASNAEVFAKADEAAIGVWLAATVSHDAMFALGMVLTVALLLALGLYTMRAKGRSAG